MSSLNHLFLQRIGMDIDEPVTFEKLDDVLERMATSIPFENLCVIHNSTSEITKENLKDKMLVKNEGGLCYELNTLLYYFLLDNGFDVKLTRGNVYSNENQMFVPVGRTHVLILLNHRGQTYIVDSGFGGNLPLKPVPFTGETVSSINGEFRLAQKTTEHGNYVLEMKLKHKDRDWKVGYAFDSDRLVADFAELNEVQATIITHEHSPFNKNPLVTRRTPTGNMTLTDTSFTQWIDGTVQKEDVNGVRFRQLLQQHFGL